MATAFPTQLYEIVSEEEALSRNARCHSWQIAEREYYERLQEQNRQRWGLQSLPSPGQKCEHKCKWTFNYNQVCGFECSPIPNTNAQQYPIPIPNTNAHESNRSQ